MDREEAFEQFHDSDSGDVYDLYNACNGAVSGGLLDLSKLDELSREEAETLDLERLKEVWVHASSCNTCENIIRTLNSTRILLSKGADEF